MNFKTFSFLYRCRLQAVSLVLSIVETNEHFKMAETVGRKYRGRLLERKERLHWFHIAFRNTGNRLTARIILPTMPIWKIFSRESMRVFADNLYVMFVPQQTV